MTSPQKPYKQEKSGLKYLKCLEKTPDKQKLREFVASRPALQKKIFFGKIKTFIFLILLKKFIVEIRLIYNII